MRLTHDYIENITNWWCHLLLNNSDTQITKIRIANFRKYLSLGLTEIKFDSYHELLVNIDGDGFLPTESPLATCLKTAAILAGIVTNDFPLGACMLINEVYEIIVATCVNDTRTILKLVHSVVPNQPNSVDDIAKASQYNLLTLLLTSKSDATKMKRNNSLDDLTESSPALIDSPVGSPVVPRISMSDIRDYSRNLFENYAKKGLKRHGIFAPLRGKILNCADSQLPSDERKCKFQKVENIRKDLFKNS